MTLLEQWLAATNKNILKHVFQLKAHFSILAVLNGYCKFIASIEYSKASFFRTALLK